MTATITIPNNTHIYGEPENSILTSAEDTIVLCGTRSTIESLKITYTGINTTTSVGIDIQANDLSTIKYVTIAKPAYAITMVGLGTPNSPFNNNLINNNLSAVVTCLLFDGSLSAVSGAFVQGNYCNNDAATNVINCLRCISCSFVGNTCITNPGTTTNGFNFDTNCVNNTILNGYFFNILSSITEANPGNNTFLGNKTTNGGNASQIYGRHFISNGVKVVGTQEAAIANDVSGAANQATVNAILASLRAHGLIAT